MFESIKRKYTVERRRRRGRLSNQRGDLAGKNRLRPAGIFSAAAFLTCAIFQLTTCSPTEAFVPMDGIPSAKEAILVDFSAGLSKVPPLADASRAYSTTALFSSPPPRSQPRRNLKKRPRRRDRRGTVIQQAPSKPLSEEEQQQQQQQTEWRPLTKSRAVEAGEDYWIDESELRRVQEKEQALKNRKLMVGEIPKEKLRTEIVAPYKQNWIGWFSVGIVMIATIVTQFPELLNSPVIPIPDL